MPIHQKYNSLLTPIVDTFTHRTIVTEHLNAEGLEAKIRKLRNINGELNYTLYTDGAPMSTYTVLKDLSGNTLLKKINRFIKENEPDLLNNPDEYFYECTTRDGRRGEWLSIKPEAVTEYPHLNQIVIGEVPIIFDLFSNDYQRKLSMKRRILGRRPL